MRSMTESSPAWTNTPQTELDGFLEATVQDPLLHARFLNMLSLLEHIGSRKIMLSQMKGALPLDVLKHLTEETRHAFFFKRQAAKVGGAASEGYHAGNTLGLASARMYFGRLDAQLTRALRPFQHPALPYLWVSLIIEIRALWLYSAYQKKLEAHGLPVSVKSLIAEEDGHQTSMRQQIHALDPAAPLHAQQFSQIEEGLFERFWGQIYLGGEPCKGQARSLSF